MFKYCVAMLKLFQILSIISWVYLTELDGRSRTSHTTPCNGGIGHGAPIGGIWVCGDQAHAKKCKQNESTIFACCVKFHTYICRLRSQYIRTWQITVILIVGKKPEYSQLEQHAEIKMAHVLGSPGLSVVYLSLIAIYLLILMKISTCYHVLICTFLFIAGTSKFWNQPRKLLSRKQENPDDHSRQYVTKGR